MSVALGRLKELPAGVGESAELIARLDQCFMIGFGRLGPVQHEALAAVAATFHGTPLQTPLAAALDSIKRSEFLSRNFVTLAAARAAIQGAQYDALFRQAAEALGKKASEGSSEGARAVSPEGSHTSLLSSAQQWLMELALAGFGHLSMETLSPFMTTLEQIQAEAKLSRVASLLTGFLTELVMASSDAKEERPVFRWVDLWTRAMILTQQPMAPEAGASVSGTFYPFGVDVREHPYFVNVLVYGLLEAGKEQRVVRISLSSYKVDVISRDQVWHLFRGKAEALMEALAGSKALQVSNMTLLSSGEMIWTGTAKVGAAFNPIEKSRGAATALPAQEPLNRHPVQLGE